MIDEQRWKRSHKSTREPKQSSSHKGVLSMEVVGVPNIHSLEGTQNHPVL